MTELTLDLMVVDEPAGRFAVLGDRVRVDDMFTHVPETIERVRCWLDERGVPCIEQPVTIFLGNGIDEWLDVEVGWPIADAEPDVAGGIAIRELPATRAAEHLHRRRLRGAAGGVRGARGRDSRARAPPARISRASTTSSTRAMVEDPADLRTRIVWPVTR